MSVVVLVSGEFGCELGCSLELELGGEAELVRRE